MLYGTHVARLKAVMVFNTSRIWTGTSVLGKGSDARASLGLAQVENGAGALALPSDVPFPFSYLIRLPPGLAASSTESRVKDETRMKKGECTMFCLLNTKKRDRAAAGMQSVFVESTKA